MEFEWDPEKAKANLLKHGVTFEEASSVFSDPRSISVLDLRHSQDEERHFIVGLSNELHILVVFHTDREGKIRIISARKATRKERKQYEEI